MSSGSDSKQNRRAAKGTQAFETSAQLPPEGAQSSPEMHCDKKSSSSSAEKKRKQSNVPQEINLQALSDSIEQDARRYAQRFPV